MNGTSVRVHLTKGVIATIWVGDRERNPETRTTRKVRAMRRAYRRSVPKGADAIAPPVGVAWGAGL